MDVEKIITIARNNAQSNQDGLTDTDLQKAKASRLHGIRRARSVVNNKIALEKLFGEYAERYKTRPGGYTRVIKAGFRPGDNAPMAYISLVNDEADEVVEETVTEDNAEQPEEASTEAEAASADVEAGSSDGETGSSDVVIEKESGEKSDQE